MRRLIMSFLIWIYAGCLSPVAVKELSKRCIVMEQYYRNELHFCGFYRCVNAGESLTKIVKFMRDSLAFTQFVCDSLAFTESLCVIR